MLDEYKNEGILAVDKETQKCLSRGSTNRYGRTIIKVAPFDYLNAIIFDDEEEAQEMIEDYNDRHKKPIDFVLKKVKVDISIEIED